MNEVSSLKSSDTGLETSIGLPHSIEAEQQLLGAILTNNDLFERVAPILKSEHFYDFYKFKMHVNLYVVALNFVSTYPC